MADENDIRNGGSRMTLAERLGTYGERDPAPGEPTTPERAFPLLVADEPVHSVTELSNIGQPPDKAPQTPGSAAGLQTGLVAAEARARRLAADVELVHSDVRRQVELAFSQAQQHATTRSSRWQITALGGVITRLARMRPWGEEARAAPVDAVPLPRTRLLVALGLVLVVGAVVASTAGGLLWTSRLENFVLDSGFEGATMRWRPAGLQTEVTRAPGMGRRGSAALRVRTDGAGDGEGPGYFEIPSIVPGKPFTFSVFAQGIQPAGSEAVYPEVRWRKSDGSLLGAMRGGLTFLDDSWNRLVVSGVAPDSTTSALLVVGEAAGTPTPVSFFLDDAQLERATTPGSYVETGEQTGGRPSHPTDLAALLMLVAAGLLAFVSLRGAVLIALPLSLAVPPSFANLESHVPDVTPTRALVIGCLAIAVARGQLRAPPRWMIALGVLYSLIVLAAFVRDPSPVSMRLALSLTIGAFAPALLVIAVARARRDISVLVISLAVTAGVVAVVALAEWYFDRHWIPLFPGVIFDTLERADHLRARATFPHPIVLGTFLAMSLQLTLSLMLSAKGNRRVLAGVGLALVLVACGLAVTLSRAPWLGAVVGLAAFAVASGLWRRWKIILAVVVAVVALVASPIGGPMRDAVGGLIHPTSEQDRFVVQVRIDLAKRIGSEGVRSLVGSSLDPAARPAFPAVIEGREIDLGASIDNTYVRELAQTGVLGLLALTALLIAVVVETSRGARRADADTRLLASGLVAAQVVVLVVGLTVGTISFSQMGTAFWLVAGAGIAISWVNRHAEPL